MRDVARMFTVARRVSRLIIIWTILVSRLSFGTESVDTIDLSLADALAKANKLSSNLKQAQLDWEIARLAYDNKVLRLKYPRLGLQVNLNSPTTVYQVPGSAAWDQREVLDSRVKSNFTGDIGIGFSEFTLFNSWIDTIDLKLAEVIKERAAINFNRMRKNVRYEVMSAYFTLFKVLKDEEISLRDVSLAKAILRLVNAKKKKGALTDSDVQIAELEVANAERFLLSAKTSSYEAKFEFLKAIGWESTPNFKLTTEPKYFDLPVTLDNLKKLYDLNSEELQLSKLMVEDSVLAEERVYHEMFPMKVTLSAVNWVHRFGYYTKESAIETGSTPNGNINVALKLAVDIPLWGYDGLFNHSPVQEKLLNRRRAEEYLKTVKLNGNFDVESLYGQIIRADAEISAAKQNLLKSTNVLSQKMSEPMVDHSRRLELKDLLSQVRFMEGDYYQRVITYNELVIRLSRLVGKDFTEGLVL